MSEQQHLDAEADRAADEAREFMDMRRVNDLQDEWHERLPGYGSAQWQRSLTRQYRRERFWRWLRDNWQDVLYYTVMALVALGLVAVVIIAAKSHG